MKSPTVQITGVRPTLTGSLRASKKRAKYRGDFFDDDAQAQVALAQFGVQFGVRTVGAFENVAHVGLVLGEAVGVRMTRVAPVSEQALAVFRHAPEQAPVFELGVFLKMDAVDEPGVSLTGLFSRVIQCASPNRRGRDRSVHVVQVFVPPAVCTTCIESRGRKTSGDLDESN